MGLTIAPFSVPMYVMLKPAGASCNLACDYCYYLEKSELYKNIPTRIMTDELLEHFIVEYINSQTTREVQFIWHGGETLLRPLSFYQKALELQKRHAKGRIITNCIQTNGTLLTDEWCRFFKRNNWLVGISIDGPREFHDAYRCYKNGHPSFDKVMNGINLLNRHGVMWNAMAVVNNLNGDHPLEFYHFFKSIGCRYLQFTPIVERDSKGEVAKFSVTPQQWGNFLCKIFDEWVRYDVGKYFIQIFDATLANWVGVAPGLCTMGKSCGHAGVMEFNGDVYSCDHFVFPEYKLGNIHQNTLVEMMYSQKQIDFGNAKLESLPEKCKDCRFLFTCNGGCPKDRFVKISDEQACINYLCEGYQQYFQHVTPYMDYMRNELLCKRPPANVMRLFY